MKRMLFVLLMASCVIDLPGQVQPEELGEGLLALLDIGQAYRDTSAAFQNANTTSLAIEENLSPAIEETLAIVSQYYEGQKYETGAALLRALLATHPSNLHVLNAYAPIIYWIDTSSKGECFRVYEKLVRMLDQLGQRSRNSDDSGKKVIYVDSRFTEAYWKLGTLYLDQENYANAGYEIVRSNIVNNRPAAQEQGFSYLTEVAFHLNRYDLAKLFAAKVIEINPENKYVQNYIEQINKDKTK